MTNTFLLLSRLGLSLIFLLSGASKIAGYEATQHYMAAMGVSGSLLPLVIALELGGGLALLAGLFTRPLALGLAAFSLASAALLALAASGAGGWSLDALRARAPRAAGLKAAA